MSSNILAFVAVPLATLVIVAYFYVKDAYSYWQKRGVKSLPPTFPYGNFRKSFRQELSAAEAVQDLYVQSDEPILGLYGLLNPILLVRDPEMIRNVLVRDAQHFIDRGIFNDESIDPLLANMFHASGAKWRNLRQKLSPTFTSGKLKAMFSTLVDSSVPLQKCIQESVSKNELVEVRDISACYATNVIASVAFGLNINAIADPDTEFRRNGRKMVEPTIKNGISNVLAFLAPSVMRFFRIRTFDKSIYDFFSSIVAQNLDYREKHIVVRKDFFQLLVQLRNTGSVQLDNQWETVISNTEYGKNLTLDEIVAQVFVFFLAGFETSSSTMSFCLYEIAKHPEIQRKLQDEIDRSLAQHKEQITYDSVNEMNYLDACIDETLRKYPPVPVLHRICTKKYKLPNTDIVIEKGTLVQVPCYAIHYDEKYFKNPNDFVPERFAEENRKPFNEMPYLPFGDGPRICIGLRMGKLQTKIGLIAMLRKFNFELSSETMRQKLRYCTRIFLLTPADKLELKVTVR